MDREDAVVFHQFMDKAARYIRITSSEEVEGYGFRYYHIPFLVAMERSPGISQKGLCERVPLDKSRVSIVVRELIGLGLCANDSTGKVWSLHLTPKGKDAYAKAIQVTINLDDEIFSVLTEEERDIFCSMASRMCKHLDELSEDDVSNNVNN